MKKSLIATAVALIGSSALLPTAAQADMSLYGLADIGYASSSNGATAPNQANGYSASGLATGLIAPSHVGIKGSRDLGDGLKADLQLEAGVQFHNGNNDYAPPFLNDGQFFNRIAAVGLSNEKWGRVSAGYQISPFVLAQLAVDPMGLSQSGSILTFHLYDLAHRLNTALGPTVVTGNVYDNLFQRSLVTYATPNFNGLTATISYGFGNDDHSQSGATTTNQNAPYANQSNNKIVTGQYAAGPLHVAAAYYTANDHNGKKMTDDATLGAGFRFGPNGQFGVKAIWAQYKTSNVGFIDAGVPMTLDSSAFKEQVLGAGADMNVTPKVNVALAYYDQKGKGTLDNGDNTKMTVLKGTYGLDKGAMLYATVSNTSNDKGAAVGPFLGSSFADGSFTAMGKSTTGYSLGVLVAF